MLRRSNNLLRSVSFASNHSANGSILATDQAQRNMTFARLMRPSSIQTQGARQDTSEFERYQGKGKLDRRDPFDPNFSKRYYYEDWLLPQKTAVGSQVEVTLAANKFDAFLYLADARTRKGVPLLSAYDTHLTDGSEQLSRNARLVFTVKPKTKYLLRVSTTFPRETGAYTIKYRVFKSPSREFDFFYGSGLVDASSAVASAVGKNPFADVAALGGDDWGRDLVKAPSAWAQGYTGQGVTVAVLDSGVDYTHSELKNNIWTNPGEIAGNGIDDDLNGYIDDLNGWDFMGAGDNDPNDLVDGHGTHVAGTIAAAKNGTGVTGVAPDAKIMPVRVFDENTTLDDPTFNARLVRGIDYAIDNGANVINLSLRKAVQYDFELGAALQRAHQAGVVIVIASGNDRENEGMIQPSELAYRASINNLGVAVGAVDRNNKMAIFANPAGRVKGKFVVAPGVGVLSSIPGEQFATFDGTSMASPHVAGVVALMLSANPNLKPDQVYNILTTTANRQDITVTP